MELWGIVSSMGVTSSSPISTMSGWAEMTRVFSGMVNIGLSFAPSQEDLHTALYRYRGVSGCFSPKLRGTIMLPSCNVSGQLERLW